MSDDGTPSPAQSQLLSTSAPSQSRSFNKQLQQTYKQASQLFLTRRLQESLSVIEPLVTPSPSNESHQQQTNGNGVAVAPVASASSNLKIKVWNLYITLLSSIVNLGPEEGKRQIGQKEWKTLASKVRDGEIWDTVVQVGYNGREGSVDADVVYNLATLLLTHSPTQTLNQERLENYLASYGVPDLDIAAHIQNHSPTRRKQRIASSRGADTPKDLTIRVRLLELFTLHVLPRNGEWEYAREFLNLSEVLDDERKETFLQTLDGLQEAKERDAERAAELQKEKEEELERLRKQQEEEEEARKILEEQQQRAAEAAAAAKSAHESSTNGHRRVSSEVDYGIERSNPNGSLKTTRGTKSSIKSSSRSPEPSKQVKKSKKPKPGALRQVRHLGNLLIAFLKRMAKSMSSSPMFFLRAILLIMGVIMALGRPDIRERIRRLTGVGWQKVRGTVGMGVKVSYI
ncbi:hypothetical protein CPC735_017960 [Coccidioides posadasii C735 delta SOWgp]|uniref:Peroxin 26 n=1 Tax=Coccidioides posadasii (strain C735) TaxID=222929 RepID=C5PDN2_COCP7|nr:hypothetical protein CPC735_017960 [Coccidioides posadasii C735 delta SOWgp]EER25193.1 hypothetical protein CPC735_017960 [Coccidioides posadasii C735 delta SOWgp]|eukprot:XP_003067338.1 hypothetical protein CPC735_017960 [Coccidioides posadasii C735 delta SOWgp]